MVKEIDWAYVKRQCDSLFADMESREQLRSRAARLESQFTTAKAHMRNLEERLSVDRQAGEINDLRSRVHELKEERDRLRNEHSNQCETIARYQEQVRELKEEIEGGWKRDAKMDLERVRELEASVKRKDKEHDEMSHSWCIRVKELEEELVEVKSKTLQEGWRDGYCKAQGRLNELKAALRKLLED